MHLHETINKIHHLAQGAGGVQADGVLRQVQLQHLPQPGLQPGLLRLHLRLPTSPPLGERHTHSLHSWLDFHTSMEDM